MTDNANTVSVYNSLPIQRFNIDDNYKDISSTSALQPHFAMLLAISTSNIRSYFSCTLCNNSPQMITWNSMRNTHNRHSTVITDYICDDKGIANDSERLSSSHNILGINKPCRTIQMPPRERVAKDWRVHEKLFCRIGSDITSVLCHCTFYRKFRNSISRKRPKIGNTKLGNSLMACPRRSLLQSCTVWLCSKRSYKWRATKSHDVYTRATL